MSSTADLLIGSTGCLGRHLLKALLQQGRSVYCPIRHPASLTHDPLFSSPLVHVVTCDLNSVDWEARISSVIAHSENVFYAAGILPHHQSVGKSRQLMRRVNVDCAVRLYEHSAAVGLKRFLYVSSLSVYGDSFQGFRDETSPLSPEGDYAISKAQAERFLQEKATLGGPTLHILRPGLIYGDRDTSVIQRMISLIARGIFLVPGSGTNTRCLSAAPLVAEALCTLANSRNSSIIVNVVDPRLPTLLRLVTDIAGFLERTPPPRIPQFLAYPPAMVFSLLARVGLKTNFKIPDVKRLTTSNLVHTFRLRELLGRNIPDYYQHSLEADIAWYHQRHHARPIISSDTQPRPLS